MEKQMKGEKAEGQAGIVRIAVNGKYDILEVEISDHAELDRKELARNFKEAYSQAQGRMQKILMEKFKGMV
jgi:DNA-binding protein YbaB